MLFRSALYCRQADSAAALLPSVQPDYLVAQAFGLADFYPPLCFVKFIGYVRAGPATFRVGPVGQMEGIRFHLCASPQSYVCAEGLAVADEFHVPQSFRLAAAIVPRRRKSLLGVNSVPHPALAASRSMENNIPVPADGQARAAGLAKNAPDQTYTAIRHVAEGEVDPGRRNRDCTPVRECLETVSPVICARS